MPYESLWGYSLVVYGMRTICQVVVKPTLSGWGGGGGGVRGGGRSEVGGRHDILLVHLQTRLRGKKLCAYMPIVPV